MEWKTKTTDEFENWLLKQPESVQEKVAATLPILREQGPSLGRPFVDTVYGSKHDNMKELRPTSTTRVFFAFDPDRAAILLLGGDKRGKAQDRWYRKMIKKADALFDAHLKSIRKR